MTDNTNKVTIDADYFAKLYMLANENQSHNCDDCKEVRTITRERDIAKSKYKELAKESDELKAKFAAAERCIEDIEPLIGEYTVGDCYPHGPAGEKMLNIIRAYRAAKEAK